ncbi:MAG: hypothetical protein AAFV51_05805 [Pseudomonadota bacterium]
MRLVLVAAVGVVCVSGCAHVEMYPKERQDSLRLAEGDPNEEICRRTDATGSRIRTQICKTREQWREEEKARQKNERDINSAIDRATRANIPTTTQ